MKNIEDKENQYNSLLRYKDENKKSNLFLVIITMLIALILALMVTLFFFIKTTGNGDNFLSIVQNMVSWTKKYNLEAEKKGFSLFQRKQNILLLGVDSNGSNTDKFLGTRSDTIILLNIDPKSKTINAISIPRDCKVYLADESGVQKINAAHALGGIELTKKTIENTLGVTIDRYVIVNSDIIKKLVDTLGGIPIYVEKNMHYNDSTGNLHINLTKGVNVLDGRTAEGYIRFRMDALGDIGRTARQQWFLRSLLKKIQSPESISKIPEILNIASAYVKTDLSLYEMSHIVALLRSTDISEIEVATLPGGPSKKGYISYWILDPDLTQDVVDRLVYRVKPDNIAENITAGIIYSEKSREKAMALKKDLEAAGYEVKCLGQARVPHSQIIGHTQSVSSDVVKSLKKKIPELKNTQFVYDPLRMYCVDSDFTIIMADL